MAGLGKLRGLPRVLNLGGVNGVIDVADVTGVLEEVAAVLPREMYVSLMSLPPRVNSECSLLAGMTDIIGESPR